MKKLFCLVLTLFLSCGLYAARTVWDYRTRQSRQQLSSENITAITRDDKGFVWVATTDEISRFDGTSYTNLDKEHNERIFADGNSVQCLLFLAPSQLMIGVHDGLFTYDIWTHILKRIESLNGNRVNSFLRTGHRLFLNTSYGVFIFPNEGDPIPLIDYRDFASSEISGRNPSSFGIDARGRYWTMIDKKLLRFELPDATGSIAKPRCDTMMRFPVVNRMQVDPYGMMWVWDREKVRIFRIADDGRPEQQEVRELEMSALLTDENHAFICSRGKSNLLLTRDGSGVVTASEELSIGQQFDDLTSTTNVFYADGRGNLWIGTRDGLFMTPYNEKTVFHHVRNDLNDDNTLSHNTVNSIYVEGRNTVWVGTAYGLNRISFTGPASERFTIGRYYDR